MNAKGKLTKTNRKNLRKLADYLESLPRRYKHFDMASYFDSDDVSEMDYAECVLDKPIRHFCGTVACAVGHGPDAGICMRNEVSDDYVDWDVYANRFTNDIDSIWRWLFAGNWEYVDNHHYGAAARIRYLLAGKDFPDSASRYAWKPTEAMVKLYKEYRK